VQSLLEIFVQRMTPYGRLDQDRPGRGRAL
jgi:hypothetical protein